YFAVKLRLMGASQLWQKTCCQPCQTSFTRGYSSLPSWRPRSLLQFVYESASNRFVFCRVPVFGRDRCRNKERRRPEVVVCGPAEEGGEVWDGVNAADLRKYSC